MTNNLDPEKLVGHATLRTGEVVTVQVDADDGSVVVALYAMPDEQTAGDTEVQPAPAIRLDPAEAELVGSLVTLGAVSAYGQRRRLRAVETPPPLGRQTEPETGTSETPGGQNDV
jgi:hypothetical protein